MFTSLRIRNFRMFAIGLFISGTGGWVQRIAQDWLVLTLTGSATAVGITTACQLVPTLVLGLHGGVLADRFPKRRILIATQTSMGTMAGILAVLTVTGRVEVWHVYLLALGLGSAAAIDNPSRQAFVNEMVGRDQLRNAIGMVSSTFQLGAMIGPVISGVLIGAVGTGYAFAFNAVSYLGSITALLLMRGLGTPAARGAQRGLRLREGVDFIGDHATVLWPVALVGTFGVFITSLPVTLAAFADQVLGTGASGYSLLSSVVAVGSLIGALLSARRVGRSRLRALVGIAGVLAVATMLAALAPSTWALVPLLAALGTATLLFLTTAQSMVQLTVPDAVRGRVMGVYTMVFIGSGAIGSPIVGWIDEHFGPRTGLLLAGAVPAVVTLLIALRIAHAAQLRLAVRYEVSISLVRR